MNLPIDLTVKTRRNQAAINSLDLKPLVKPTSAPLESPRFARPIGDLFHRTQVNHEPN